MAKCNELFQDREECFEYLDELRESGKTNMFGATPFLISEFGLNWNKASDILVEWMRTYGERHSSRDSE